MISPSRGGNLGVKLMYFLKNLLLYPGAWFRQTVYSNDDQGRVYQNCNFHDPRAGVLVLNLGQISHIVKIHYFFKNLLLYSQAYIKQTRYKVMMTKEGSTKIVNFLTPWQFFFVLKHGYIRHIVNMHLKKDSTHCSKDIRKVKVFKK